MGEPVNASVGLQVVIDGGSVVERVSGGTAHIDEHGFLHVCNSKGEPVGIFAKFDYMITDKSNQE